jgi:WD40 repeat protein/serine/threonine protein kinase
MNNLSGHVIKSYTVVDEIAAGGFGAVYRAYQPIIEREVALKVILPRFANEPDFIRRFEVEAQTIARLEHPYIVPLYDFWRDPNGAYLVMRLMRGGNLRDRIRREILSPEQVLGYLEQVASSLSMAHRNGIIHRDIKPENILLDEEANAYLSDFGIAQMEGITVDEPEAVGSANYMPPEIIRSEGASTKSDIYSLGVMLYELLIGRLPFASENIPQLLVHHLHDALPDIRQLRPALPDALNYVLQKATSKDPELRFENVRDLARAFKEAIGDRSPSNLTSTLEMQRIIDNPYKGLRSFDESDAADFFGRDKLIQALVARLNEDDAAANFLAVVGPSGSGKSSVVRAGLIPQLSMAVVAEAHDWYTADLVPSSTPIANLANALLSVSPAPLPHLEQRLREDPHALDWAADRILGSHPEARLFIFIDQFEEVFTLVEDEAEREEFLALLSNAVKASGDVYIVVTIRADFFDKPLFYEGIGDLIQRRTQVVLPLSSLEIEQAIVGPAERVGLQVERNLVGAVVADVKEEPGALPLLQYALTELFERREGNQLKLNAYIDSGGVQGALARRAQEVYEQLDKESREIARQIFLRLITLGEGTEDTRRRARRAELFGIGSERALINRTLDGFGKFRLLTFDSDPSTREPTVEIAHEALIRRWDLLKQWLDESRTDIRLQRTLGTASQEWEEKGRANNFLLYGGRLLQFQEWANQTTVALSESESAYLESSIAEQKRREEEEKERQGREEALRLRVFNRTRLLAILMSVAALLTAGLTVWAVNQSQVAQEARATSDANAQNAEDQLLLAEERAAEIQNFNLLNIAQNAVDNGDSGLAMSLLGIVAESPELSPSMQNQMVDTAYASQLRSVVQGHTRKITALALSPDGSLLVTGSEDTLILLWNSAGEQIGQLVGHRGPITDMAFSPDGTMLLSGGTDAGLILWDILAQQEIRRFAGHRNVITSVDFSPDGNRIVSSSGDGQIILWELNTGEEIRRFDDHSDSVRAVVFSPDGTRLLSGSRDKTLILWNVETGSALRTYTGHAESVETVVFSPDGTRAYSGSFDRSVIAWDIATGQIVNRFIGHSDEVTSVAASPDGRQVISTSCAERDLSRSCIRGEVIIWDTATGREARSLSGHHDTVNQVVISPDSQRIYTGSCGERRQGACILGEVLLWDSEIPSDSIRSLSEHNSAVLSIAINKAGNIFVSGGGSVLSGETPVGDTSIILWDTEKGTLLHRFEGHEGNVTALSFHPSENSFLSASDDTTIRVWSLDTREELRRFEGHDSPIQAMALSHNGTTVLSSDETTLLQWDYATGSVQRVTNNLGSQIVVTAIAFSPDDSQFATGLNNGTIIFWDTASGEEIRRLTGHTDDITSLTFSADGQFLASGALDRSLRYWDLSTGESRRFDGHTAAVTSLALTEAYLLSASDDNTLRYWDLASGETIRVFIGHTGSVTDLAYDAATGTAVSSSADGTVREWRISLPALLGWMNENRYSRPLSEQERLELRIGDE